VGKTTYLTMLCWIGGNKNKEWNFKVGGSGLDVTFIPSGFKRDKYKKKKFVDLVDATTLATGKEINKIFERIGNRDGSFSTTAKQEFVFSFRPLGADKEHTILTLDYPGEWLSKEQHEARIEGFAECLVLSRALIIMIDPIFYLEDDKIQVDFYSYGLEKAQNRLRAKDRPKEFVPVKEMPVAVIINKADLLPDKILGMNPKEFLMNNCRGFYNSVNKLSKNWEAFFVSCYGIDSKVEKIDDRGFYKPPPSAEIKPLNLNEPFEWIYRQRKKRTLQQFARAAIFIILSLCLLYAALFTWDSLEFRSIEKQETAYLEEPGVLCEKYTGFDNLHIASPLTGFKKKVKEKRKYWANQYLNHKLKYSEHLNISDFSGIISQVQEWCLDVGDEQFYSRMETRLNNEVKPKFENRYAKVLYEETDLAKYENKFIEFRKLFPGSAHLPLLQEKNIYINIYTIANSLEGATGDFNKMVQYCHEYINTSSQHSNKYRESVDRMLAFANSIVDSSDGIVTPKSLETEFLGFFMNASMLGTHTERRRVKVESGWSERYEYRDFIIKNKPEIVLTIEISNRGTVFQEKVLELEGYESHQTLKFNTRKSIRFSWMPGEEIKITVRNLTGNSVEIKRSGILAINLLLGEVNIDNEVVMMFTGEKMVVPPMAAP
ncbi:MAG: hypothetical protein JSV88_20260, partial [Candidatus Aminicenantes bacterium]